MGSDARVVSVGVRQLWLLMVVALGGGLAGGIALWIAQGNSLVLVPAQMTYSDLVAVLLTGVSLVVSIFGVIMAVLAIWGYAHFKRVVQDASVESARVAATESAKAHVAEDLKTGEIRQYIATLVSNFLDDATRDGKLPGMDDDLLKAWMEERRARDVALKDLDEDSQS